MADNLLTRPAGAPPDLVGVDPGLHGHGWARFRHGELVHAGHGLTLPFLPGCVAVLELMEFSHRRTGGGAQDLIRVQNEGALAVGAMRPAKVITPMPSQWKGSTPKAIHHTRVMRALSDDEKHAIEEVLSTVTKKQGLDVLDGVGLGLWGLRRIR